jgi:hypothetical protein
VILGEAMVPGTDIKGRKLAQYNPGLGLSEIQQRAADEAAGLGSKIDPTEVERSYLVTISHLKNVQSLLTGS